MALDDIFRALDEQAQVDISRIGEDAQEHAQAILDEAKTQVETIQAERIASVEAAARARGRHLADSARLEAKRQQASIQDESVENVFGIARTRLGELREAGDYPAVFRRLLEEALPPSDAPFAVRVDERDVQLASETLTALGRSGEVFGDLSTAGGVVVTTDDGLVSRRNTFEDRLDKYREIGRADVARIVFA